MTKLGTLMSTAELLPLVQQTPVSALTIILTAPTSATHVLATWTALRSSTVSLSGTPALGALLLVQVTNDSLPRTITFSTGFVSLGPVVGVPSKVSTIMFVSNGVAFYELSRTVGL